MSVPVSNKRCLGIFNVGISVQVGEEGDLVSDGLVGEITSTGGQVAVGEGLRLVPSLHGVNEVCLVGVTEICESGDVESSQHFMVLVDQVVTMEHVEAVPWCIPSNDLDGFRRTKPDNIFERNSLIGLNSTTATDSRDDLEIDEMDVDGMRPTATTIGELPNFNVTTLWLGEDSLESVGPGDTVDLPLT